LVVVVEEEEEVLMGSKRYQQCCRSFHWMHSKGSSEDRCKRFHSKHQGYQGVAFHTTICSHSKRTMMVGSKRHQSLDLGNTVLQRHRLCLVSKYGLLVVGVVEVVGVVLGWKDSKLCQQTSRVSDCCSRRIPLGRSKCFHSSHPIGLAFGNRTTNGLSSRSV